MNLYGLWITDQNKGGWVRAIDCAGDPFLVYESLADAEQGAKAHRDLWDIQCEPKLLGVSSAETKQSKP